MKYSFAEYLLNRDEEMAFYVLEQDLDEGLVRGLKGIWNIARGGRYNRGDAKSAMNTASLIANIPDIGAAGSGILNAIRGLGVSAAMVGGGGDMNYKPPQPIPIMRSYTPPTQQNTPSSIDIFRSAKAGRKNVMPLDSDEEVPSGERDARKFGKASAFDTLARRRRLGFIDQMPSA